MQSKQFVCVCVWSDFISSAYFSSSALTVGLRLGRFGGAAAHPRHPPAQGCADPVGRGRRLPVFWGVGIRRLVSEEKMVHKIYTAENVYIKLKRTDSSTRHSRGPPSTRGARPGAGAGSGGPVIPPGVIQAAGMPTTGCDPGSRQGWSVHEPAAASSGP
jgi:hypothetical protein